MECRGIRGWARLAGALALVFAAQLAGGLVAGDWPQFRGVNRNGVSAETGLLRSWPEDGPREVWRVAVGEGFSGISAVGERIYTMYAADRDGEPMELAAAFDAETGKEIWSVAIGKRYDNVFGNGPRSTPTVVGDVVYVLGSMGDLLALGAEDGAERWRISFTEDFGAKVPNFGFSTSALIDGPRLVVETGGPEGKSLAALDRESGEVEWTFGDPPGDGGGSYNSPILVKAGKTTRYVYIVGDRMTCLDDSGKEVWSHPWTYPGETHAMPVFVPPNRIFASGAEGVGATLVVVKEKGGRAEVGEVWKSRRMKNHFSSSVVHDGTIYGFDNATLRAMSVKDASTAWAKRGLGKGSLIYADGRLLVLSDQGILVLVEAQPGGYVETGRVQALEGRCWTAPALADGRLYLRSHEEMVAYDVAR